MIFLATIPVGLIFLTVWAVIVDTSATLSEEERIRGWGTVVRELPATIFLMSLPLVGLVLAVLAGHRGSVDKALRSVTFHGVALFFVQLVIMNGSAETIMTTRSATVKWMLLPFQVGVTLLAVLTARRSVSRHVSGPTRIHGNTAPES